MKKIAILFVVFIVPVIAYLLLRTGKNYYKTLPVYGIKQVDSVMKDGDWEVDTIYHTIGEFNLTNYDGRQITRANFDSSIYVADFFFATCPSICPKMSTQMARLQEIFKNVPDVKFVSHTVNPEHDSVAVLAQYADEHKAIKGKWYLLTGDKKQIYDLARTGYLVNAVKGDGGPDDFIHSELFVLIDKQKRIRGFYDGTNEMAVDTCADEIKVLLKEYTVGKKK